MKKFSAAILLMLCLFAAVAMSTCAVVIAQEEETETTVLEEVLGKLGAVIPVSFVVAFVTVMLGYLRNTPPEAFEVEKFFGTLILAIVMGVVTTAMGWDYTTVEAWLGQAGITIWVYWFAKVIAVKLKWAKP